VLTRGPVRWSQGKIQSVWYGNTLRSGIPSAFAARSAAVLMFVVGSLYLALVAQPPVPQDSDILQAATGAACMLAGVLVWRLPWARWSSRATLWLIPVGLTCVALGNVTGGRNPWDWSAFFLLVFVWIGICQKPGTSVRALPLFVVAYGGPLLVTEQTSAVALTGLLFVGVVCAVTGESVAWVTMHWRRAESQLGALMSNLPGMAYNCIADSQWTMRFVSAGCEALTGYPPRALIGNATVSYADLVWADDRAALRADIEAAIAAGSSWTCTYRIVTAGGETRWVWERGQAVDGDEAVADARVLEGFIQDVTAQRKAEERLTDAALEWRQTFDAMHDSVAVLDARGVVLRCNKATTELADLAFDRVIGGHCFEAFHGTADFGADCPHQRARASGHSESSVLQQGDRWLRVTFEPVVDAAGGFAGGIHVVSDISELKGAEQRLIASLAKVKSLSEEIIATIAGIVEFRDPYTAGHQQRVSELGAAIAAQLGLDDDAVAGVRVAGLVHDVGKIVVPAEILNRPGRLSETEFMLIKEHAQTGFEILRAIDFPWPVAEVARQHHERLDRSGYPQALGGDEILLEARIIAVADVVEAMASDRPYRAALGTDAALAEIEAGSGAGYDEAVVAACKAVLEAGIVTIGELAAL
jgi:putative nucleotidyltransferase with HDIG domain/PAS domain S-box-containing protein